MNRIISSGLASALIFGAFLPREEAVAQTTYDLKGLREEAQAYGILLDKDKALMQTGNEVKGLWEEWLREEALMQAANEQTVNQQKDVADQQTFQQAVDSFKGWDEAVIKGDAATIASYYASDAVFVTPEGPIIGREAIQKWYTDGFQNWHATKSAAPWDGNVLHVIGTDGNQVWASGEWDQTGPGQDGKPISIKGRCLDIYVREGDTWKVKASAYNVTPAPAPATASAETK